MDSFRFSRESGLTHAEFFRSLPAALDHHPFSVDGDRVVVDYGDRRITIVLGPQQVRRIAMLEIPYTILHFSFDGFSPAQRTEFMDRFNLYFRRGGG